MTIPTELRAWYDARILENEQKRKLGHRDERLSKEYYMVFYAFTPDYHESNFCYQPPTEFDGTYASGWWEYEDELQHDDYKEDVLYRYLDAKSYWF